MWQEHLKTPSGISSHWQGKLEHVKLLSAQFSSNTQNTAYNYYSIYLHHNKSSTIILPTGILPNYRWDTTIISLTQTQNKERMFWQVLHAQRFSANTMDKAWASSVPTHPSSASFQIASQCSMFPAISIGSEPWLNTFVRITSCPIRPRLAVQQHKYCHTRIPAGKSTGNKLAPNKRFYFQRKLEVGKVDGT